MKASDIKSITKKVTKKWTAQRKREERSSSARFYRREYINSDRVNQTDVAWEVISQSLRKGKRQRSPAGSCASDILRSTKRNTGSHWSPSQIGVLHPNITAEVHQRTSRRDC